MTNHPRQSISTNSTFEQRNGYSRLLRVGPHIWSAGTLAIDNQGDIVHPHSHYQQTTYALDKIEAALKQLGADRTHITRTRLYITQASHHEDYGKAHADFFQALTHKPAATMVEVKGLVSPHALIEVEIDAYING